MLVSTLRIFNSFREPYSVSSTNIPFIDMVMDLGDLQLDEEPHGESKEFYDLLKKAEEPLWLGCKTYEVVCSF